MIFLLSIQGQTWTEKSFWQVERDKHGAPTRHTVKQAVQIHLDGDLNYSHQFQTFLSPVKGDKQTRTDMVKTLAHLRVQGAHASGHGQTSLSSVWPSLPRNHQKLAKLLQPWPAQFAVWDSAPSGCTSASYEPKELVINLLDILNETILERTQL